MLRAIIIIEQILTRFKLTSYLLRLENVSFDLQIYKILENARSLDLGFPYLIVMYVIIRKCEGFYCNATSFDYTIKVS